jgi:CHAT domain-containing protein/Tfp pilus assembly protein PilF
MNGKLSWGTVVGRALLSCGPLGMLGVAWCAGFRSLAVAEVAAPVEAGQFDKTGPVDGAGAAPAEPPVAATGEVRDFTLEEQAQLVDAKAKNDEVVELYNHGRYAEALVIAREALAIRRRIFGEEHPAVAQSLDNLGNLLQAMGDYAGARPNLEQALAIRRKLLGEEHPDVATSLNNVGMLLQATGDYAAARPYLEQALAIFRKVLGQDHPAVASLLNNLGGLLKTTGDYAAARPYYEQALAIGRGVLGAEHPDVALTLNNLGVLLQATGDNAAARPYFEQALAIHRQVFGEENPATALSLNNLGSLLQAMGDYAAARPYYEQALAIRRKVLGEEHPAVAASLTNLGGLLETTGDFAAARPYFKQALAIVSGHLEATALALSERQQLDQSRTVQGYLDNYLNCLSSIDGQGDAAFRAALAWKGSILLRQRAARAAAGEPELAPLFADLQSAVRQWAAMTAATPQGDLRAWQERLDALKDRKEQLEVQLAGHSAAFRAATMTVGLDELVAALPEDAALVDYLECWRHEPSPETPGQIDWRRSLVAFVVRPGRNVEMFDLGEIKPIGAAIDAWRISYGRSTEAQAASRLLRERLWQPLEAAIGYAETVLISPDGALGKLPFAALPGRAQGTYLIEDYRLALVPVPRLIPTQVSNAGDKQFDKELLLLGGVDYDHRDAGSDHSYAPAGLLALAQGRSAARASAAGLTWDALPGAGAEVAAIRNLYRELVGLADDALSDVRGAAATEENFRALAPHCRILHLATHGFFATEDKKSALAVEADNGIDSGFSDDRPVPVSGFSPGLLSGLVLAGANDPPKMPDDPAEFENLPEDGILTADELAFLPLEGVRLVVLSACETGLGKAAGGEGLLGIQRAFQVAGARTTVASLWKVDDAMTQRLMTAFYRNVLEEKQSYLDALRNAQLEMLRELRDPSRRDALMADAFRGADDPMDANTLERGAPYFWAAFTLSGDWR